jgi:hypothetical protein
MAHPKVEKEWLTVTCSSLRAKRHTETVHNLYENDRHDHLGRAWMMTMDVDVPDSHGAVGDHHHIHHMGDDGACS